MPLDKSPDQTATPWPEIDRSLLEETRPPPVPFPLDLLPDRWRAWVEHSAQVFTPVDYYAQGLFAAVAAACGGGIVVRVTPQWAEPLLLWQALVGPSSSGKSPALSATRRLLDGIAVEDEPEPAAAVEPASDPVLALRAPSPQAATQWREDLVERLGQVRRNLDLADWLAGWDGAEGRARAPSDCDISGARSRRNIMGGLAPGDLAEVFGQKGEALAARFLYAWPEPAARAALGAEPADDDSVRGMLRRILGIGGTLAEPGTIEFEAEAITRFEQLLPLVRQRWRDAEGWEAAWLGKGAGMIVRLAGLLTLMHWAQEFEGRGAAERGHGGAARRGLRLVGRLFPSACAERLRGRRTRRSRWHRPPRRALAAPRRAGSSVARGHPPRCALPDSQCRGRRTRDRAAGGRRGAAIYRQSTRWKPRTMPPTLGGQSGVAMKFRN